METQPAIKNILEKKSLENQLQTIREISESGLPFVMCGGFAFAALTSGQIEVPRTDIDFVISRQYREGALDFLKSIGCEVKERIEDGAAFPIKAFFRRGDTKGDCIYLDFDENGPYIDKTFPNMDRFRVHFSKNWSTLAKINGIPVKTVSPEVLVQSLNYYGNTGIQHQKEKDIERVRVLKDLIGESIPDPVIEKIN